MTDSPTPALTKPAFGAALATPAEGSAPAGAASVPLVVAIDGPAGSGKSSVSRAAAERLGYGFLDTGAAYRALAWHALAHGVDTSDATAVLEVFGDFDYAISLDTTDRWVRVGGVDVTAAIREPRVTDAVSGVARVAPVRHAVTELFRRLVASAGLPGVVVEGRDITTVVFPDAPVRILLTAAPEVRAARRSAELTDQDAAKVAAALHQRDAADSTVVDFLTAADGVEVVDSTHLDFAQTVDAVLRVVETTMGARDGR
ncbi:(d)CMP kinase [Microbacterium testaceum]|uniref:Cytidylate kinase n=1 Tax=Microbacterium testaceum TaxID=2033 RepID=A0A2T7WWG5_MICTE|nr:(d)CMP kinase [Microbacterium testaceum]PVE78966.1 (d)CMP kinase [Microbacterium testaceum]